MERTSARRLRFLAALLLAVLLDTPLAGQESDGLGWNRDSARGALGVLSDQIQGIRGTSIWRISEVKDADGRTCLLGPRHSPAAGNST